MLLIDAPPAAKEVEFRLQVRERSGHAADPPHRWRPLADVSPVVRSLAHEQFDSLVKRVRVFAPAPVASAIAACSDFESLMLDLAGQAGVPVLTALPGPGSIRKHERCIGWNGGGLGSSRRARIRLPNEHAHRAVCGNLIRRRRLRLLRLGFRL